MSSSPDPSKPSIQNRLAKSQALVFDLAEIIPAGERVVFDLKDWLHEGIILKEKKFRTHVQEHNWETYEGKNVAVLCSEDVVIPTWAYMIVVAHLAPFARVVICGSLEALEQEMFRKAIARVDLEPYIGRSVVIRGCSNPDIPYFAYGEATRILSPLAKLIKFGEPCSSVPVYKQPKDGKS
ncbi:MAG: DUF2480 family protein [Bernardetiaceae bacterium]